MTEGPGISDEGLLERERIWEKNWKYYGEKSEERYGREAERPARLDAKGAPLPGLTEAVYDIISENPCRNGAQIRRQAWRLLGVNAPQTVNKAIKFLLEEGRISESDRKVRGKSYDPVEKVNE